MSEARNSDLIREILAERQKQNAVILSIPALPPKPTAARIPGLEAQRVAPVAEPAPTPDATPEPITDTDLSRVLDLLLPGILSGVDIAVAAFRARKLSITAAVSLGTTLAGIVSLAVKEGAPLIRGQSARVLVLVVFSVIYDRYLLPLLPVWLRPFSGLVKGAVVKGLESLYLAVIKKS